jgi:hypothetical protein
MVRAILDGRKTQTRRVIKPQPSHVLFKRLHSNIPSLQHLGTVTWVDRKRSRYGGLFKDLSDGVRDFCSYGKPGDQLWVREAWRTSPNHDCRKPSDIPACSPILHLAGTGLQFPSSFWGRYRHARFMPRWASRITLEITNIRVERVQSISEADAMAEGIVLMNGRFTFNDGMHESRTAVESYKALWESINGCDSWDANPWVWVIEFKRITQ